ncbi:MAG: GTP-binding protein [Candidatus Eisenbacteria bacterium]|nr:GTP-binding protein [Candidatus Eisenbacteria bacterium]
MACHGGIAAGLILEALVGAGARPARPGEFTQRAFLNGRIDLSQAEAVAALVAARSQAAHRAALRLLKGHLGERLDPLLEDLIGMRARLEAHIEFPEDMEGEGETGERRVREGFWASPGGDREPAEPVQAGEARRLVERIDEILRQAGRSRLLESGLRCVLSGPVNVGKSSLFNAILDRERAIVTEEPGTTRDVIEGTLEVGGIPVELVDTAGLRMPESLSEAEGTRRSDLERRSAALVLEVRDASRPPGEQPLLTGDGPERVVVLNKCDLGVHPAWESGEFQAGLGGPILASALKRTGITKLLDEIRARVAEAPADEVVLNLRQRAVLGEARERLAAAADALESGELPELVSFELAAGAQAIGEILGRDASAEMLAAIFQQFCIGK